MAPAFLCPNILAAVSRTALLARGKKKAAPAGASTDTPVGKSSESTPTGQADLASGEDTAAQDEVAELGVGRGAARDGLNRRASPRGWDA